MTLRACLLGLAAATVAAAQHGGPTPVRIGDGSLRIDLGRSAPVESEWDKRPFEIEARRFTQVLRASFEQCPAADDCSLDSAWKTVNPDLCSADRRCRKIEVRYGVPSTLARASCTLRIRKKRVRIEWKDRTLGSSLLDSLFWRDQGSTLLFEGAFAFAGARVLSIRVNGNAVQPLDPAMKHRVEVLLSESEN